MQAQTNNTIKGGCIMDIWHRVGRIVRFSNLGTLLFFTLNILLIVAVFGSSGSIVELICIYFFTVAISLSPLGEMCLAAFAGASDIKRVDIKLRVVPLVQYVLDKAKENTSYCPKKVKDEMKEQAEKAVKSRLVIEAIIKEEDIKPEEKEVEEKLKEMAKNYGKTEEEMLKNEYVKEYIENNMKFEKAIKFIVDNAKFKK